MKFSYTIMDVIEIKMRDQVVLRGTSYITDQIGLTLLSCSPYRNFENIKYFKTFGKFLSNLQTHYIYMDVRGTGESDGYAENEYTLNEKNDMIDILRYIRAQPWSNGIVMMHGISYSACNALQATTHKEGPDALFIMHVSASTWENDIHYLGGVKTITEDINYSFATTGQNLLHSACKLKTKTIEVPWYMKWFEQSCPIHNVYKTLYLKLPPTLLICGWRDSYSKTAVRLCDQATFTLIGPFGHSYPYQHDEMVKQWIYDFRHLDELKQKSQLPGNICIVIPTPRSLWRHGYYQIKTQFTPVTKVFSLPTISLYPDLVGDTLEPYCTGDPVCKVSLENTRRDLCQYGNLDYEFILNHGVWGEPKLVVHCSECVEGDYIVGRLVSAYGETLSVGVSRLKKGKVEFRLRPLFLPVKEHKVYLFINRSWVPVLYPTTHKNVVRLSVDLCLPLIDKEHYVKLNVHPNKADMERLKDVKIKRRRNKQRLDYETKSGDSSFTEEGHYSFTMDGTRVKVENHYYNPPHHIKTITEIKQNKTDHFDVEIEAYNHATRVGHWKKHYDIRCD